MHELHVLTMIMMFLEPPFHQFVFQILCSFLSGSMRLPTSVSVAKAIVGVTSRLCGGLLSLTFISMVTN